VGESKEQLRASIRAHRRARSAADLESDRPGLTSELLKLVLQTGARRIMAFLPTDTEPPITEFLALAHHQGVGILTPRAHDDGTMTWVDYHPDHDQVRSVLGVPEIAGGTALDSADALSRVDLVLVPAAAVDTQGTRLGWGKGFYDRALEQASVSVPVFAVVFDDEVLSSLPREQHDQPVTGAVTPQRTLVFG
jgi:5-formyltetrahydrofolate cyclo-ligase